MTNSGTDSSLEIPAPPPAEKPKLRGLWGMMRPASAETPEPAKEAIESAAPASVAPPAAESESPPARPSIAPSLSPAAEFSAAEAPRRGLWALMGGGATTAPAPASPAPVAESTSPNVEAHSTAGDVRPAKPASSPQGDAPGVPTGGKGLWALMRSRGEAEMRVAGHEPSAPPPVERPTSAEKRDAEAPSSIGRESSRSHIDVERGPSSREDDVPGQAGSSVALPVPPGRVMPAFQPVSLAEAASPLPGWVEPTTPATGKPATAPPAALAAAALGGASIPLSMLAWMTPVWLRFPSSLAGFLGMAAGLMAWNELAGRRQARPGYRMAVVGLFCGVAGMFLGPLVFAPLGASFRESSGQRYTARHLAEVGGSLNQYQEEHRHFPAGGVFHQSAEGREIALHGWMTSLLPYLGEASLYESIQQQKPFDHPDNRAAMSRQIPAFLAFGGDPAAVRGMAPSHFAGVGGETDVPGQGVAHFGVFGKNSAVRADDVVDGLSNTLIVGEISQLYPPWGDPENWRSVGSGLNRQHAGFGNAEGTGATFLKADGSVQFFSNKTSPEVLQRLMTRDGGEVER